MNRRTIVCAPLFLLLARSLQAQTGFLDRTVEVAGHAYKYKIYVPAEYSADRSWPVILFLHGGTLQGDDGERHVVTGLAGIIRADPSRFPAIVVFPQAQTGTGWFEPEMQALAMATLDRTLQELRADANRVYLTGHSMGAIGAYRIAYRWPERFAALLATAGRVETGARPGTPQAKVDHETNPFTAADDPFLALAARIRSLPTRIFHGDADQSIPVEQSRRLSKAFRSVGANATYTEYPNTSHDEVREKAWADPATLAWLFAQHR